MSFVKHLESKGVRGWIIQSGTNWYGPYDSREMAERHLGRDNGVGGRVSGTIIPVGL